MMKEYLLGAVGDLPDGHGRAFAVGQRTVAVFRSGDAVFAINNRCIHKGASICEGALAPDACEVRCPWHNWPFNLKTGEHRLDPNLKTRVYDVRVEQGQVILRI